MASRNNGIELEIEAIIAAYLEETEDSKELEEEASWDGCLGQERKEGRVSNIRSLSGP